MKVTKSDIPKDGWKYLQCDDLGGLIGHCELCGAKLRFQHSLEHENVGLIKIGVECCQRVMTREELDYIRDEDKRIKTEVKTRVNKEKRQRRNFEERNEFYRKRGLPELTWEEYQMLCNKNRRNNSG